MYKILIILLGILFCSTSWGQQKVPRTYIANHTNSVIKIDGKATELEWSKAKWSEDFIDIEGIKTPKYKTRFKMLWDEENMYYFVDIKEPHVWGNLRQRDTVIFHNNDFEIFWEPDGDTHNYYEFEINVLNTIWDLFLTKPYRDGNATIDGWDIKGLQSAIVVNGTLNSPKDIDKGWQLELAVPWAAFRTSYGQDNVPRNKFWRINFSRVNWDFELHNGIYKRKRDANNKLFPEYNWVWSPQGVINMHQPETWGYVYFTDKPIMHWKIPQEEQIRWHLYTLYRQIKNSKNKHIKNISELNNYRLSYNGKTLTPVLEYHKMGWNIFLTENEKIYLVNEEGKFKIKTNKDE